MHRALAFALAAATLAGAAQAVDVYKWKDAKGVVHYGDRPASGVAATPVKLPDTTPSAEDEDAANERLARAREKLAEPVPEDDAPVPVPTPRRKATSYDCEQQWARYGASQACYINHRVAEGKGVSPAGIAQCRPLPQPSCER